MSGLAYAMHTAGVVLLGAAAIVVGTHVGLGASIFLVAPAVLLARRVTRTL